MRVGGGDGWEAQIGLGGWWVGVGGGEWGAGMGGRQVRRRGRGAGQTQAMAREGAVGDGLCGDGGGRCCR